MFVGSNRFCAPGTVFMASRCARSTRHVIGAGVFAAALVYSAVPGGAQSGPFVSLAGSWSGGGSLTLQDGARERLRCHATYAVSEGGTRLQQNLRCASDSYRFDVNANVVSEGGALTGTWSETSRNTSGSVAGRVNGGQIQAQIEGPGFTASMAINTRGNRQSVSIQSPGHEVTQVSIEMTKSR